MRINARRIHRLIPLFVSASVLLGAGAASGQHRRPSEDTLSSLSRTLGHVGSEGRGVFRPRDASSVASVAPQAMRRSSGASPNGYQPFRPSSSGRMNNVYGGNPWVSSAGAYRPSAGMSQLYPQFSTRNPVLLYRPGGEAAESAQPDVALKAPENAGIAPDQNTSAPIQLRREQLVKNYIDNHRAEYFARGWAAFKAGQYRQACDLFGLAEAVSFENPAARAEAKFALLHASIASHQYALAITTLRWLLQDDPRTGQMRDPGFLNRITNIETLYPSTAEYIAHARAVEDLSITYSTSPEIKALRAVILWGQNDRSRAMFIAKELAGNPENGLLTRLHGLMEAGQAESIFMSNVPPASKPAQNQEAYIFAD